MSQPVVIEPEVEDLPLEALDASVTQLLGHLTPEEAACVEEIIATGNHPVISALLAAEYEQIPVDPETFFTDPYYLGVTGVDIYPRLLDDLIEICRGDYTEVILGGSIGWGKSTITEFGLLWLAYETACLRDPQRSFGLMAGSPIVIVNVSVTESQARKAIFGGILNKVRQSQFFREEFPFRKDIVTELKFPKNITIFPGASTDNSILGLNVIGGALDEGNFMPITDRRTSGGPKGAGVYDKAESLYTAMIRRMKSRFLKHGKLPGKLFTPSSAQYPGDFIDRRIKKAVSDPSIFVRSYALWEVKREQYSSRVFQVEVGTDLQGSRILTGEEKKETVVGQVIEVPVDFLRDFEKDIDGSIRDIAGISTLTIDQYIKNFAAVVACINPEKDPERKHPFTGITTTLGDGHRLYRNVYLVPGKDGKPALRYNPKAPRVAHIDLSLRQDATGLAVGHIRDMVKVLRRREDGTETEEWAPFIVYDLMLRIVPPKGGEIPFDKVRDVLYDLKADGMDIKLCTLDGFQSADTMQQLRKKGILSEYLSIDRTIDPYDTFKSACYERRIDMYEYAPALEELRRLEHDKQKNKVDHPENGSKDVSDAMAGVAYSLTQFAPRLYKPQIKPTIY